MNKVGFVRGIINCEIIGKKSLKETTRDFVLVAREAKTLAPLCRIGFLKMEMNFRRGQDVNKRDHLVQYPSRNSRIHPLVYDSGEGERRRSWIATATSRVKPFLY